MITRKIFDLLTKRVLVTRDSARAIQSNFASAIVEGHGEVALDFAGVDGLTPSFLDETLAVIEECVGGTSEKRLCVILLSPSTQLSTKVLAVGRGHDLIITESENGA